MADWVLLEGWLGLSASITCVAHVAQSLLKSQPDVKEGINFNLMHAAMLSFFLGAKVALVDLNAPPPTHRGMKCAPPQAHIARRGQHVYIGRTSSCVPHPCHVAALWPVAIAERIRHLPNLYACFTAWKENTPWLLSHPYFALSLLGIWPPWSTSLATPMFTSTYTRRSLLVPGCLVSS